MKFLTGNNKLFFFEKMFIYSDFVGGVKSTLSFLMPQTLKAKNAETLFVQVFLSLSLYSEALFRRRGKFCENMLI